ncbi:probable serine/threonine-protein kinase DDB_G0271682 [Exaiptasia diaphana]|uniref:Protein kinase domain-containing protein n=1 Tax=Exaiptasia diaphana TaxID=2652724 RepID=A0A913XQW0_EXADI|nr:probable serine/threonine-protein kinase DDB_G0271682 [Exaiptasia diaphana]
MEQERHEQTQRNLEAEQERHESTRRDLQAEQERHEVTRRNLEVERDETSSGNQSGEIELRRTSGVEENRHAWILDRIEVEVTEKVLGRGGWGSVLEGRYRGTIVAVKQIHDLILSPYNRNRFEREMNVAARCRHPYLLQFIGATNDASPLFVTELLDTSLRAVLEERALQLDEQIAISLDVARALNYLHLNRPDPIIHRDISSANVLLWKHGERWRAKVSDYGSANFLQHCTTVGPGAMVYCAPEALSPSRQTVKLDVFSFGVLVCEMNIRELPDFTRRGEQVAMVTNHFLSSLIRRCLVENPEERPCMVEILSDLEGQN